MREIFNSQDFSENIQKRLCAYVREIESQIKLALSKTRKNIIFWSSYPQYRKHYGNLMQKLAKKYNVIVVFDKVLGEDFEKSGTYNIEALWRSEENDNGEKKVAYLCPQIEGIDLIISADQVGYLDGKIDREFLSKSAPRIYLPHRITSTCGNLANCDYFIAPSPITLSLYQNEAKNLKNPPKILELGYPYLDLAIENFKKTAHKSPKNTLAYAPTLRYGGEMAKNNALFGFDVMMIEWLLANYSGSVLYHPHPINFGNNTHKMVVNNFKNEPRFVLNTTRGSGYFSEIDFMISDWSGSGVSFALSTGNPCFFYDPLDTNNENIYTIKDFTARNLSQLKKFIESACDEKQMVKMQEQVRQFAQNAVFNLGCSEQKICEAVDEILG